MEITPVGLHANASAEWTTASDNGRMDKMDFLRMMIAQLKYQDPLNPMDNTDMMAQMAQFSQLEQMLNMSSAFTGLQTVAMLGRTIKFQMIDGSVGEGKVVSVSTNDEAPLLKLEDGSAVALQDVLEVSF